METTIKYCNSSEFSELVAGDTFIDPEYDEETVLMVVNTCIDLVLKPDGEITKEGEYDGYAVDLTLGRIIGYNNSATVFEVESKLTAYRG